MAWYSGTYSCGHDGRVNVIGPGKDRQWKIDRHFSGICDDCRAKERELASKEAAEKAKEMELPELTGSEKQIAWAVMLRDKLMKEFTRLEEPGRFEYIVGKDYRLKELTRQEVKAIRDYIVDNEKAAKWYIDNRNQRIDDLLDKYKDEALRPAAVIREEKKLIADIEADALIVPENATTTSVATIQEENGQVVAWFEKNEEFREIVKGLGYTWDRGWRKKIFSTTGTAVERMAELGSKLLAAGFPVKIYNAEAKRKAIEADYEPEHTRWIYRRMKGDYEGRLAIKWAGRDNKLYDAARSLPGSRWDSEYGTVVVKVEKFEDVEEFARLYEFRFTKEARRAIEDFKMAYEDSKVTPAEPKVAEYKDGLAEILDSSRDILGDLREED